MCIINCSLTQVSVAEHIMHSSTLAHRSRRRWSSSVQSPSLFSGSCWWTPTTHRCLWSSKQPASLYRTTPTAGFLAPNAPEYHLTKKKKGKKSMNTIWPKKLNEQKKKKKGEKKENYGWSNGCIWLQSKYCYVCHTKVSVKTADQNWPKLTTLPHPHDAFVCRVLFISYGTAKVVALHWRGNYLWILFTFEPNFEELCLISRSAL